MNEPRGTDVRRCGTPVRRHHRRYGGLSRQPVPPVENALDLLEDIAGDDRPYLDGASVRRDCHGLWLAGLRNDARHAAIDRACAAAWPTPFGSALNGSSPLFDADVGCLAPKLADQLTTVAGRVCDFARWRRVGSAA